MLNCTQRLAALFSTDQALAHQWREIDHSNGQDCLPGFLLFENQFVLYQPFRTQVLACHIPKHCIKCLFRWISAGNKNVFF